MIKARSDWVRSSSCKAFITKIAPVAPTGWPSAIAPPFGFTRAASSPKALLTAKACAAKASLDSITSKSSTVRPVFCNRFCTAGMGPIPITAGRTPACAYPNTRARGRSPAICAAEACAKTKAAAPSLIPDALPAVTEPSFWNTGRNPANAASSVCLGCSSQIKSTLSRFTFTDTGVIWSSKRPSRMAAAARV